MNLFLIMQEAENAVNSRFTSGSVFNKKEALSRLRDKASYSNGTTLGLPATAAAAAATTAAAAAISAAAF